MATATIEEHMTAIAAVKQELAEIRERGTRVDLTSPASIAGKAAKKKAYEILENLARDAVGKIAALEVAIEIQTVETAAGFNLPEVWAEAGLADLP